MSRQIQIRRGSASDHANFTGAIGEITMDTTNKTLRVHDGTTAGGTILAKKSEIPTVPTFPDTMDYVVETQLPTSNNNYTWYRKYKSGLIDMGGHYTGNAHTVTLPVILNDNNYEVIFTKNSAPSYWASTHLTIGDLGTTSFTIVKYGDNASIRIGWLIMNAKVAQ